MNSISNFITKNIDVLDSDNQYICIYDTDLILTDCCNYYATLNGMECSELIGASITENYTALSNGSLDDYKKVLASGIQKTISIQFTTVSNKIIYVEEQIHRLNSSLVVVGKDITERKKKEEQEYALSLIAKHSTQYFLIVDLKGTILFIDKTYRGMKLEDVIGSNIHDYNDEETELKMRKTIKKVIKTKESYTYEAYADVGEEDKRIFEGTIFPIIEDNGEIIKLAITTNGITERKNYEDKLKEINAQYLNLLQQTESIAFTQDSDLKYTNILNPIGILSKETAIGKTDRDIIIPFDKEAETIEAIKLEVLHSGKALRKDIKLNINGETFYFDLLVQPLLNEKKEISGIHCTSINITERANRKEILEESERKLIEADEIAQMGYYDLDIASRDLTWSEETYKILDLNPNEFNPNLDLYLALLHEEDRSIITEALKEIINNGENLAVTYRVVKKNEEIQYIKNLAKARFNSVGEVSSVFGTVQDVTQEKVLELELKEQKEFIQKIVDSSPSLIFILDIEKHENVFINNASEQLLGYSKEEVRENHNLFLSQLADLSLGVEHYRDLSESSTTFLSFIHPAERQLFVEFVHMFTEDKTDQIFDLNFRHQHKKGHWLWLHHRLISFKRNEEGKLTQLLGIVSDISSLKEAEKKSKLSMIEGQEKERRRIAKDLHDAINPLLSAAKLNVESIQNHNNTNTELQTNLAGIVSLLSQSMESIKDISFDLMPAVLKDFGLVFTLKDYCNKISEGGALKVNLDIYGLKDRLGEVKEIMLFRIAQELINNVIKHANATQVDVQLIAHQKTLLLMVEDNGKGMNSISNTSSSKGYGLKNIESRAKTLSGTMMIDSVKNRGTIITIEIPRK